MISNEIELESISGNYAINTKGQLQWKPCQPMRFCTEEEALKWAASSGIRTPLIPVGSHKQITLDSITRDLPKLRTVASFVFSCGNSSFSLSQYSAWKIQFAWEMLGLKTCIPENYQTSDRISELREACVYIEGCLIEARFEDNPLAPPYVIGLVSQDIFKN